MPPPPITPRKQGVLLETKARRLFYSVVRSSLGATGSVPLVGLIKQISAGGLQWPLPDHSREASPHPALRASWGARAHVDDQGTAKDRKLRL